MNTAARGRASDRESGDRGREGRDRGGRASHNWAMTAARDECGEEDEDEGNSINSSVIKKDKCKVLVKFIADSGATEHLSRTKLTFEKIDDNINHTVKCANKDNSLKTIGSRSVKFKTKVESLYSNELLENSLPQDNLLIRDCRSI